MDPIGPISFQAARAYGVVPVPPVASVRVVGAGDSRTVDGDSRGEFEGRVGGVGLPISTPSRGGSKARAGVARLVAGVVPGKVDFSAGDARSGGLARPTSFSLYHHPAEMNAAATGVGLGRMLDTTA